MIFVIYQTNKSSISLIKDCNISEIRWRYIDNGLVLLHRKNKPACLFSDGYKEWYEYGYEIGYCNCYLEGKNKHLKVNSQLMNCIHPTLSKRLLARIRYKFFSEF